MASPSRISVRLDGAMRAELNKFMTQYNITASQAIRVLLDRGLGKREFTDTAFKEGVNKGMAAFFEAMQRAAQEVLGK